MSLHAMEKQRVGRDELSAHARALCVAAVHLTLEVILSSITTSPRREPVVLLGLPQTPALLC